MNRTVKITAADLARIVFWGPDKDIEHANKNWGFYEGTELRVRLVPADAVLTVTQTGLVYTVTDDDSGWIAERFTINGVLNSRQGKEVFNTHGEIQNAA